MEALINLESDKLAEFPHELFDRWDILVHAPDDGEDEPVYAGRFELQPDGVKTTGLYDRWHNRTNEGWVLESNWINGWGYPCTNTLLASPAPGNPGTFFRNEADIGIVDENQELETFSVNYDSTENIDGLLRAFSQIADNLNEGVYDKEMGMYDFGDATDSAIITSEILTGRRSKQRIKSQTFDASKKIQ